MTNNFLISASPHIKSKTNVKRIMWAVVLALLPSGIASIYIFGIKSLYVIFTCIASACLTEAFIQKFTHKPIAISDGSALITGILLAYNLPPAIPLWIPALGAIFAIAIVKCTFGGLGRNIFNPALAGRAFLMISWPEYMTSWVNPRWWPDGVSSATPLAVIKTSKSPFALQGLPSYLDLFIGNRPGCIGEVCIIALLIGAAFLLWKGYIRLFIPFTYIFTVGLLSFAFAGDMLFSGDWLFYIMTGGLILGAFFMATDMVTTPITRKGMIVFGVGCGLLTFCIRKWGGYPEGVSYSILMMNAATPLIDRFTKPKVFGGRKNVSL